jgi:hypothetical protein
MASLVIGAILILAGAAVAALEAMWRARERRDGLR